MNPRLQGQLNWSKQVRVKWWYHGLPPPTRSLMTGCIMSSLNATPIPECGRRWPTAFSLTHTRPITSFPGMSTTSGSMPRMTWASQIPPSHQLGVSTATKVPGRWYIEFVESKNPYPYDWPELKLKLFYFFLISLLKFHSLQIVRFQTSASRGLRQFWSLWKCTVHPKVTSCTWPVPCAGAQHPACPGTWTTSASTRTKIITSPIRAACAPCTFSESGRWTTANIRSLLSILSAKQNVLLNSLLEVSTFEENSLRGFIMKCF